MHQMRFISIYMHVLGVKKLTIASEIPAGAILDYKQHPQLRPYTNLYACIPCNQLKSNFNVGI